MCSLTSIDLFLSPHKKTEQQRAQPHPLARPVCSAAHFNYPLEPAFAARISSLAPSPSKKPSTFLHLSHMDYFCCLKVWLLTSLSHLYLLGQCYFITHDLYVIPYALLHSFFNLLSLPHAKFLISLKCSDVYFRLVLQQMVLGRRPSSQIKWTNLKLQMITFSSYGGVVWLRCHSNLQTDLKHLEPVVLQVTGLSITKKKNFSSQCPYKCRNIFR